MHGPYRLRCQHAQDAGVAAVYPVKFAITGQPALTRPLTNPLLQATFAAVDRQLRHNGSASTSGTHSCSVNRGPTGS